MKDLLKQQKQIGIVDNEQEKYLAEKPQPTQHQHEMKEQKLKKNIELGSLFLNKNESAQNLNLSYREKKNKSRIPNISLKKTTSQSQTPRISAQKLQQIQEWSSRTQYLSISPTKIRRSTISQLTGRLNAQSKVMLKHVKTGDQSTQSKIQQLKEVQNQIFTDIKSQLKFLEERLNNIRSQDDDQNRLLNTGTKHTIQARAGSQNYFKIISKNKPSPMFIRVSNCQNPKDFKIYISETQTKPEKRNSSLHQNICFGDWEIKIQSSQNIQNNSKKSFAHDFFYMGVFSSQGTIAQITIQFGMAMKIKQKKQIKAHQLLRSFKLKRDPYDEFLDHLIENPQESKRFYDRVEQIRKEKVLRSLYMAGNRDLVLENIMKAEKQIDMPKKLSLQAYQENLKLKSATEKREQQERMKMRKMRFFMIR